MGKTIELNETDLDSRAKAVADSITQAAEEAAERASSAWRETQPARRDAAKALARQGREFGKWMRKIWRQEVRPNLRRLWSRRTVALGAAGAAVPASRQLIEDAAAELGLRPRSERHWGAFLVGIIVGAATGMVIALLTAPKPGAEIRDELAARARDAAEAAGEWIPVNIASASGNGGSANAPLPTEVETET